MVHKFLSQEEYDTEKKRCLDYMGDRVIEENKIGDNWIEGWNHNRILRKDNKIWQAECVSSCYCEGIERLNLPSDVFSAYEDNRTMFTIALGTWSKVSYIMDLVYDSVERGAYEKLKKAREQEKLNV